MNYNFGGNFPASMYNLLASGSSGAPGVANPQLYGERLSEQQYSQSQQQRSISPSLNYHQNVEEERASGERKSESWRETERHYSEKSSKKKSRSPDRYYRSDRSSRHRSRSKSRSPSRYSRRRRSRSRSKSRSRERSYRRRSSRSPRRSRDKSKSPSYQRRRSPVECPSLLSPKVMLINLPINADRDTINILIAKQGFHPIDIRIVRKGSDAGNARVFGFVEFSDSAQAQAWITYNNGHLTFDDGYMVKLELSRETEYERRGSSAGTPSSDWTCAKCTINNFNRRTSCFKCGTSREQSEALEGKGYSLVGVSPCDTLLVRELPASATEESIRLAIVQYTGLIVQRLQLASSKSYALAQMKSVEEACSVLSVFNKTVPYVDNCAVIVTFSRQSLNQILIMDNVNLLKSQSGITSVHIHEDPINSAAQLAQTAIQMVQMGRQNPMSNIPHHEASNPTPQSISTPFGYLQAYPTPNPKTFQLEPQSGYNYDVDTGFYYDPKTEYYYNPKTNQWMFWCSKYSTFISCEGGDIELKKRLQEEEKDEQKIRNSAVISAPPSLSANASLDTESSAIRDALKAALEQNQKLMEALKNQTDSAKSFILHPDLPKPSEDLPMHSCDPFNVHELTNHETLSNSRDHSMRSRDELPHESKSRQDIRSSKNLDHVKEKESDRRRHHSRESEDRHRRDISKRSHYVRDQASRSDQRESPDRMEIGYDTDENPIIGHSSWRNPTQNKYEAMSGIQRNENQRQTTNTLVSNTPDHLQKPNSYIDRFMDQSQISFNSRFPPPGTSTPNAQQMMTPSPFNTTHQLGPPTSQMTCRPNDSRPGLPQPGTSTPNVQQMMTPSPFSTTPHQMGPAIPPMLPMYPSMPLGTPWNNSAMPGPSSSAPGPWNTSNYAFGPPHFASAPLPPRFQVPCGVPQPFPGFPAPINPIAAQQKKKSRFEPTKNMKRRLGRAKLENEVKQRKKEIEAQKKEKEQKKMQLIQKEQEELKALNICFNCGGRNHQQFSCQRKPIGEQELQVILACARERLVREKKMISELKKQADSYHCSRSDPLIIRFRKLAPSGKITKEHLRLICDKCASLGHINKYCRGDQVDSSIVKMVRNAVNKFSKIFFFHLQEDNLVDLSKNFARFEVMDSIESTTVDPVSIQLQDLCPDGIVRQRDLTLCSKCGGLGHSKTNCNQQKVPRELYEKMLQLVTAYRALVKEGKGRYKLKGIVNPRPRKAPEVVTLDDEEDDMGEAEELTDDEANGSADLVLTEVVEDESDTNDIVYVEHDENGVENEVNQDDEVVQAIVNLILDEIDGVEETVVPTSKNVELPFQDANKDDDSDIIIIS